MLELRRSCMLLVLLLQSSLTFCVAHDSAAPGAHEVDIYHRIVDFRQPVTEQAEWQPKGKATWSSVDEPVVWSKVGQDVSFHNDATDGFYQVGLSNSDADGMTSFSSVSLNKLRACSAGLVQEYITLQVQSEGGTSAPRLSYRTHCSPGSREWSASTSSLNTTVVLSIPMRIPGPILHKPVAVIYEADGRVKQPEPEKSFIQKYWMYIVPVLLLVLLSGGSDEGGSKR